MAEVGFRHGTDGFSVDKIAWFLQIVVPNDVGL